ncbi:biotin--[acetyl-CoA-carboxylase] ligase [Magnetospirillum fulvum]|uniref:biotin--[biotin carboxyl-carrier protein] ligase n=1 Tax=Magnetospirillum fulvum TaxID=1082 RepID=A0A1H6HFP0_MAGFU|nr:biotin--[acetyl-CoA-carboxylase] ligase [Magnetospirillum fulvum]SEH32763.1 BirA family transcriptional regulator, biotin operon repressor / biotin-[acetyl-CoA-carboxylase] ligase [Magnetospirillum fulvum]
MSPFPDLPDPFDLLALEQAGSTNDEARRLVDRGQARDLLVVTAKTQTAGRGRRGRTWVSPAGNLHASLLIRQSGPLARSAELGFAAAAALAAALAELVPAADFRCKWPNDVMVAGGAGNPNAKIAGMLLDGAGDGWLVLGLGVNVAAAPPPDQVMQPATALAALGWSGGPEVVLAEFCRHFGPLLAAWRAEGFAPLRRAWLERALGLGETAMVRLETETLTGRFAALDDDGALVLDQGPAGRRRILAGDVFFPAS